MGTCHRGIIEAPRVELLSEKESSLCFVTAIDTESYFGERDERPCPVASGLAHQLRTSEMAACGLRLAAQTAPQRGLCAIRSAVV
jgi:hypothetical protein